MAKKHFKQEKKAKVAKIPHILQTADEYLAAGVDEEEGGEKWRAGDAAKALRFFSRAIAIYEEGTRKFPSSFDLIYNLARLQYAITQSPPLMKAATFSAVQLLQAATESGKRAMQIDPQNTDNLYNLGQCLTSLGEELAQILARSHDSVMTDLDAQSNSAHLLEQANDLFQKCLFLQQQLMESQNIRNDDTIKSLTKSTSQFDEPSDAMTGIDELKDSMLAGQPQATEEWVMAVEPVTWDSLLDTILAQLATLTSLCELRSTVRGKPLSWIRDQVNSVIPTKLLEQISFNSPDRAVEIALANAIIKMTLVDTAYKERDVEVPISIERYCEILQEVFFSTTEKMTQQHDFLCARADASLAMSNALKVEWMERNREQKQLADRWNILSSAMKDLAVAARLAGKENNFSTAKIHIARGDGEILRYTMGCPPFLYEPATKHAVVLLQNAYTYYTGAERVARVSSSEREIQEALVKLAVVDMIKTGESDGMFERWFLAPRTRAIAKAVLDDAVDDGLLENEAMPKVLGKIANLLNMEPSTDAEVDHRFFLY